ncbi:MAG: hypothetical protein RLY71_602 [Pseudomonadota bacterium]|jgi:hypothetical protein
MTSQLQLLTYGAVLTISLLSAVLQPEAAQDWSSTDLGATLLAMSTSVQAH